MRRRRPSPRPASLIAAQRTADAPADVLERAAALVRRGDRAPRAPPGRRRSRARTRSACRSPAREQFATGDPAPLLPVQPGRRSAQPDRAAGHVHVRRRAHERERHARRALHRSARHRARRRRGDGARRAARRGERVPRPRRVHRHAHHPLRTPDADRQPSSTFDAWVDRTEGRKVFTVGTISAGGEVTARADGVFIRVEHPIPRRLRADTHARPRTHLGRAARPTRSTRVLVFSPHFDDAAMGAGPPAARAPGLDGVHRVRRARPTRYPAEADRVGRARRLPDRRRRRRRPPRGGRSPRSRCSAPSTAGSTSPTTSTSSPTSARPPTTSRPRSPRAIDAVAPDRGRAPAGHRQPRPRGHPRRRRAGRRGSAPTSRGSRYEDAGYKHIPGMLAWRVSKLFRSDLWPTPMIVPTVQDHARKRAAIECYASQLGPLRARPRARGTDRRRSGRAVLACSRLRPPGGSGCATAVIDYLLLRSVLERVDVRLVAVERALLGRVDAHELAALELVEHEAVRPAPCCRCRWSRPCPRR